MANEQLSLPRPPRLVLVSGNMGAGKTTLTDRLRDHFGWWVAYESVADNPYLADFYSDMDGWAFHLQLYFLGHRSSVWEEASNRAEGAVIDGSIYADRWTYAKYLHSHALMSDRDMKTYVRLHTQIVDRLRPPDLILNVTAPVSLLEARIKQRQNGFDDNISTAYLQEIAIGYRKWVDSVTFAPVLEIDSGKIDFRSPTSSDFVALLQQINKMLE